MSTLMKRALEILELKGRKALELAKEQIMLDKIEDQKLRQTLEYYAKHWNDTLHPGIISLACEAVGGDAAESLLIQVPMLFLTAAIDIHDDIIDGSEIKNGKRTIFGKFGRDVTLLVGDGMLLKGMLMLHKCRRKIPTKTMNRIVSSVETAFIEAGDAHVLEVGFRGKIDIDPRQYFYVLEKKASILEAHTRIGALIGGGTQNEIEALGKYGRILGTLITLRDEFIDILEVQELNERMKNKCLPLPMLYAFRNPQTKKKMMNILSKPKISEKDINLIAEHIFREKEVKPLRTQMKALAKKALQTVSNLSRKNELDLIVKASLENI
jgi:geranylgeranyl diphosphate synthase type I